MMLVLRTMLAYGIFGPIIGSHAMIFFIVFSDGLGKTIGLPEISFVNVLGLLSFAIPVGYFYGGLQALFVGLVVGMVNFSKGLNNILIPLAAAFLIWAIFSFLAHTNGRQTIGGSILLDSTILWLALHLISAGGVWILEFWFYRKRRA